MRSYALILLVGIGIACFMEVWAAVLHRMFWHGALWKMHRSHHSKKHARFEANDILSALHAPIAIVLIVVGCGMQDRLHDVMLGIGYGMTLFGFSYLVIHDGFIHGRLPVAWLGKLSYFRDVREAHMMHHHHGGERGRAPGRDVEPYGLFLSPFLLPSVGENNPRAATPKAHRVD
jgi:beta-carotene 3-hydroxylase